MQYSVLLQSGMPIFTLFLYFFNLLAHMSVMHSSVANLNIIFLQIIITSTIPFAFLDKVFLSYDIVLKFP